MNAKPIQTKFLNKKHPNRKQHKKGRELFFSTTKTDLIFTKIYSSQLPLQNFAFFSVVVCRIMPFTSPFLFCFSLPFFTFISPFKQWILQHIKVSCYRIDKSSLGFEPETRTTNIRIFFSLFHLFFNLNFVVFFLLLSFSHSRFLQYFCFFKTLTLGYFEYFCSKKVLCISSWKHCFCIFTCAIQNWNVIAIFYCFVCFLFSEYF